MYVFVCACVRAHPVCVWWQGGALDASGGVVGLSRSNFTANAARFGGAVCAGSGAQFDVDSSAFRSNAAQAYGGAIDASACRYVTISE